MFKDIKKERKNTKSMRRKLERGKRKRIKCVQRYSKILETYSSNEVKIETLERNLVQCVQRYLKILETYSVNEVEIGKWEKKNSQQYSKILESHFSK